MFVDGFYIPKVFRIRINFCNLFVFVREGVQTKKTFLNGHCPDRSDPPPSRGNGQRGPFFRPSKTTFKRVLRNQIPIENDRENDEYDDENGDNFDV